MGEHTSRGDGMWFIEETVNFDQRPAFNFNSNITKNMKGGGNGE